MNIEELFKNLSLGELSNLSMSTEGNGTIAEDKQPQILLHAANGLLALYTRFVLAEKDVLIEQQDGKTTYKLSKQFAYSTWNRVSEPHPYINDMGAPFTDDVIRILEVFDSLGRRLPLNDDEALESLYTPQPKVLQVPRCVPGVCLDVKYQAKHPPLDPTTLEQELELPEVLNNALTAFIGWRVYSGINTQEAGAKAQEHKNNFDSICLEAIQSDVLSTSVSTTNIKFHNRGWR